MSIYELRTFIAAPDQLEELMQQWQEHYLAIYREFHDVVGAFVSHPEHREMPDGIALLMRHDNLAAADAAQAKLDGTDRIAGAAGTPWDLTTVAVTRQVLSPTTFSTLA